MVHQCSYAHHNDHCRAIIISIGRSFRLVQLFIETTQGQRSIEILHGILLTMASSPTNACLQSTFKTEHRSLSANLPLSAVAYVWDLSATFSDHCISLTHNYNWMIETLSSISFCVKSTSFQWGGSCQRNDTSLCVRLKHNSFFFKNCHKDSIWPSRILWTCVKVE